MFKIQQVLRSVIPLQTEATETQTAETLPASVRVTVLKIVDGASVRARVSDPAFPSLAGRRIVAPLTAFVKTSRGRPKSPKGETPATE